MPYPMFMPTSYPSDPGASAGAPPAPPPAPPAPPAPAAVPSTASVSVGTSAASTASAGTNTDAANPFSFATRVKVKKEPVTRRSSAAVRNAVRGVFNSWSAARGVPEPTPHQGVGGSSRGPSVSVPGFGMPRPGGATMPGASQSAASAAASGFNFSAQVPMGFGNPVMQPSALGAGPQWEWRPPPPDPAKDEPMGDANANAPADDGLPRQLEWRPPPPDPANDAPMGDANANANAQARPTRVDGGASETQLALVQSGIPTATEPPVSVPFMGQSQDRPADAPPRAMLGLPAPPLAADVPPAPYPPDPPGMSDRARAREPADVPLPAPVPSLPGGSFVLRRLKTLRSTFSSNKMDEEVKAAIELEKKLVGRTGTVSQDEYTEYRRLFAAANGVRGTGENDALRRRIAAREPAPTPAPVTAGPGPARRARPARSGRRFDPLG